MSLFNRKLDASYYIKAVSEYMNLLKKLELETDEKYEHWVGCAGVCRVMWGYK